MICLYILVFIIKQGSKNAGVFCLDSSPSIIGIKFTDLFNLFCTRELLC